MISVMTVLVVLAIALALLPVINTFVNLMVLRRPPLPPRPPSVAILIPARNEEANIGACIDAALASRHADIEIVVLDDDSSDATAAIVQSRAVVDPRVRLVAAPPLPPGWKGKPHACQVLSAQTTREVLLFVDADVRLSPDAAACLAPPAGIAMVSGVPRQRLGGLLEAIVIPMINSLLLGYLPMAMMRQRPLQPSLAAACGQLVAVRAEAYRACGGHAAVAQSMHDGLMLARHFRASGFATDLADASDLAHCRMYDTPRAVWDGFAKNATEGMAKPLALPVWTVLLGGGVLLPIALCLVALLQGEMPLAPPLFAVTALLLVARTAQALRCREPWFTVPLYPLGVLVTLAIQWTALIAAWRGRRVEWRGRSYVPLS
jgi:hypothetical protein